MDMSSAPGLALARPPPARGSAPCILFDALRDAAGEVSDFRWRALNPAAEALVGELEAVPGGSRWEEGVAGLLDVEAGARVVETGWPHRGEVRCQLRGGERRFHATLVRQGDGLALWLEEVTEPREEVWRLREELAREREARVRAEEALAARREPSAREEQLLLALETARMVTWEWTRERRTVTWSAHADAFFGQPPGGLGDTLGGFLACVYPEDRARVARTIEQGLAAEGPYSLKFRCRWADGSVHCYEAAGRTIREGTRARRLLGVVVDCTERERAMELLAREAYFRERFIGILGHDLRNPLNAIALSARGMRRRGALSPAQHDFIQRIETCAARMGTMISDILDLTRARLTGGIPLTVAPVRLSAVCRQVVEELSAGHPGRLIAYEEEEGGEGLWDAERLAQVVGNLVSNALEHGPEDTPVVLRSWREGDVQVLEVNNQGPPIERRALATLFEPFRQGEDRRRRRGGLGLGLFIVKELVQAHGGRVTVTSTEEDGTTFTVLLPYEARLPGASVLGPSSEARSA